MKSIKLALMATVIFAFACKDNLRPSYYSSVEYSPVDSTYKHSEEHEISYENNFKKEIRKKTITQRRGGKVKWSNKYVVETVLDEHNLPKEITTYGVNEEGETYFDSAEYYSYKRQSDGKLSSVEMRLTSVLGTKRLMRTEEYFYNKFGIDKVKYGLPNNASYTEHYIYDQAGILLSKESRKNNDFYSVVDLHRSNEAFPLSITKEVEYRDEKRSKVWAEM